MTRTHEWMSVVLAASIGMAAELVWAQGPLTPPGAPAPTMKTLQQIEPRTPIGSLPYSITNSGSYYLTTNLTGVSGSDGIDIKTNNVTLDLNGFLLQGVAGSGNGINVLKPAKNMAIRNGVLDSWGTSGVDATNAYNSQFERLMVSKCSASGISVGSNSVVLACTAGGNSNDGIDAGINCMVKDCAASDNGGDGIFVYGYNCTVIACTAGNNGGTAGIYALGNNCTVQSCTASGNSSFGVDAGNNCTVQGCTASGNSAGICAGNNCTVQSCTASGNSGTYGDGILVAGNGCQISGNTCSGNGSFGIEVLGYPTRIDGNSVGANSSFGIFPHYANAGNSITRNSSPGIGYAGYTGNNDYAPTGSIHTTTNPWANF